MIRLWGRITSINVRKVALTLRLLDVPYERIDAGLKFGVVTTPEYLARNPNALVPLLDDDGYELWESNVIVRYLAARYGDGRLYPQDLHQRFDAERWMDWQQTTMNKAGREAFVQVFRTPVGQRNAQAIADSVAAMEPLWDIVEARLARGGWMAGSGMTMADIPLACERHRWLGQPHAHPVRPHLDAWYARIRAMPAAQGVLDISLS